MDNHNYFGSLVGDPEIVKLLSKITGEDVWNATYHQCMDILVNHGLYITVVPVSTFATHNHLAFAWVVYQPVSDNTEIHKYEPYMYDSKWEKAADSAILCSCELILSGNTPKGVFKTTPKNFTTTDANPANTSKKKTTEPEPHNKMDHKLYGRHSEEDPLIFE